MAEEESIVDNVYRHKNGNIYRVEAESQTKLYGVWHDSITYVDDQGRYWNRIKSDFLNGSFKLIHKKFGNTITNP